MTVRITSNIQSTFLVEPDDVTIKSESGLTGVFTLFGNKVFEWCNDNGIDVDLITKWSDSNEGFHDISAWRIADPEHRLFFKMYWQGKIWK